MATYNNENSANILIAGGAGYYFYLISESRDLADFGADHAHALPHVETFFNSFKKFPSL